MKQAQRTSLIAIIASMLALCQIALAEQERVSREEWRIGIGGIYAQQDFPILNAGAVNGFGDISAYGGYISGGGDYFYKRFKTQVFVDAIFGNSTRNSFNSMNVWAKFGLNLASQQNPLYINIGIFGDYTAQGTSSENNRIKTSTVALSVGVDGWLRDGEKLRYEYSADYDYIFGQEYAYSTGGNTFAGYYAGDNHGSYGIRASVGFSYQFKDDLFYYVKLRAKYQNITYNPTLPTTQNLVGMVEIGLGGK